MINGFTLNCFNAGRSRLRLSPEADPINFNQTAGADFPNVVAERRSYVHDASDAMFRRTASFVYVLRYDSAQRHIFGVVHPGGGYDPKIQTRPRFLCNAPTPKYHPMYTRSEVIVLTHKPRNTPTNKQTPPKTANVLLYATTLDNHRRKA